MTARSPILSWMGFIPLHTIIGTVSDGTFHVAATNSDLASKAAAKCACDGVSNENEIQNTLRSVGLGGGTVPSESQFNAAVLEGGGTDDLV